MKFVIVEDDHLQAGSLRRELERAFKGCEVQRIPTESEFRERLPHLAEERPDFIIMDVMLRWTDPSPDMKPAPEEVTRNGPARAGFRCLRLLGQHEELEDVDIILHTVLEQNDLGAALEGMPAKVRVTYLPKSSDYSPLLSLIRDLRGRARR